MIAQIDGYLTQMVRLKDKGWKVTIHTQELRPDSVAVLAELCDDYIKVLLTDENISDKMIKDFSEMEINLKEAAKTPSERLRGVLYVYWEQHGIDEPFETFYLKKMNNIIETVKSKLT